MEQVEMVMPKMGESIMEGTILSWLKKEGDRIEQDESVLEVATDKVDTEVPATHGGILKKILAKEGEVVEVGRAIAIIATEATNGKDSSVSVSSPEEVPAIEEEKIEDTVDSPAEKHPTSSTSDSNPNRLSQPISGRFYSPLVLNIAKQENISMQELEYVAGRGKDDRVTKKDILQYLESKSSGDFQVREEKPVQISVSSGEDEIIEMDRMRKMIAQRMVDSKRIS